MGFSAENGYTPLSIETIMDAIRVEVNTQFATSYTPENFVGSNMYKYFYAGAQELQKNEVKASEIFLKLQQYFVVTNETISRPVATPPGLIEAFSRAGFTASVKPPIDADAGKIFVAVDVDETADEYAAVKLAINTLISQSVAAGIVSQGSEVSTIVLSNGQPFDFKFNLPDRVEPELKLTISLSDNNQVVVGSDDSVKQTLMNNIAARYKLGKDFEPQRYFNVTDAPWASQVVLEYSLDAGATWSDDVFESLFDDLFVIKLENIQVVAG